MSDSLWKRGRPTKYHSGLCEDLVNMMSQGHTNCWVAAAWNISESCLYNWLNEYPDLKEAYDIGLPKCQVWWEQYGKEMMDGQRDDKGFKPWIAFMNQKFKYSGYGNQAQQGNTVHIGNVNVLSLDNKTIDQKLSTLIGKYGANSLSELQDKLLENDDDQPG